MPGWGVLGDIAVGPDGNLWFAVSVVASTLDSASALRATGVTAGKIGRITPTGAVTLYPLPTAYSDPGGIAAGPDGNLWFTETIYGPIPPAAPRSGAIARITTDGVITEYAASHRW